MIGQKYIPDLMSILPSSNRNTQNQVKQPGVSTGSFKDILGSSVSQRNEIRDSRIALSKKEHQSTMNSNGGAKLNRASSYREVVGKSSQPKEIEFSRKPLRYESVKEALNKEEKQNIEKDAIIESLAQMLGINAAEFTKLLEMVHIKPDELVEASKAKMAINKLADLLQLTPEQEDLLFELVKLTDSIVEEVLLLKEDATVEKGSENILRSVQNEKNNAIKVTNPVTIVAEAEAGMDISKIMERFKLKLEQIRQKLSENPGQVADEILQKLQESLSGEESVHLPSGTDKKADMKILKNQEADKADVKEQEPEIAKAATESSDTDTANEDGSSENSFFLKSENDVTTAGMKKENSKEEVKPASFENVPASVLTAKASTSAEAVKATVEAAIPKHEIVNQVIEKAKVVLNGDKSEMVMELKPDSLGKLSLKVVTENGIVVAKFIAENQQVKQVLESNMQLLKDSLEKQGMTVSGFSVSVRQESSGNSEYNGRKENGSRSGWKREVNAGEGLTATNMSDEFTQGNPYIWSESSINLTA